MNNKNKKLYAKVDPEYLKKVSDLVGRDLKADKDDANYNSQVISNFIDNMSISLRDAGQSDLVPGDGFKIDEEIEAIQQNRVADKNQFEISKEYNFEQENFPFSDKIEREQRTKHILRTEALDTFDSMMDELDIYMPQYISMDMWIKIKMAMSKGNERIAKNQLIFIGAETVLGKEMRLSQKEMEKYQLRSDLGTLSYDLRPDGPDLLSMKELVRILKGENVSELSFAFGFFAKYSIELNKEKIAAIKFHVHKNKLKEIDVFEMTIPTADYIFGHDSYYGAHAKSMMILSKTLIHSVNSPDIKTVINSVSSDDRYYIVSRGAVGGPKDPVHFGYEENPALNDTVIPAGEVFLYKKINNKICGARIYFTPDSYANFHPYHQHGSVIFGNNDYSYQSYGHGLSMFLLDDFIADYATKHLSLFEPAFAFVGSKKFPKKSLEELLEVRNEHIFFDAVSNLYEECSLLIKYWVEYYYDDFNIQHLQADKDYSDKKGFDAPGREFVLKHIAPNFSPFHKRWKLETYLKDGCGMVENRVPGIIDKATSAAESHYAYTEFQKIVKRRK